MSQPYNHSNTQGGQDVYGGQGYPQEQGGRGRALHRRGSGPENTTDLPFRSSTGYGSNGQQSGQTYPGQAGHGQAYSNQGSAKAGLGTRAWKSIYTGGEVSASQSAPSFRRRLSSLIPPAMRNPSRSRSRSRSADSRVEFAPTDQVSTFEDTQRTRRQYEDQDLVDAAYNVAHGIKQPHNRKTGLSEMKDSDIIATFQRVFDVTIDFLKRLSRSPNAKSLKKAPQARQAEMPTYRMKAAAIIMEDNVSTGRTGLPTTSEGYIIPSNGAYNPSPDRTLSRRGSVSRERHEEHGPYSQHYFVAAKSNATGTNRPSSNHSSPRQRSTSRDPPGSSGLKIAKDNRGNPYVNYCYSGHPIYVDNSGTLWSTYDKDTWYRCYSSGYAL